jgi:hypothetical protein
MQPDEQVAGLPRWLVEDIIEHMEDLTVLAESYETLEEYLNHHVPPFDLAALERSLLGAIDAGMVEITEWKGEFFSPLRFASEFELDRIIRTSSRQTVWLKLSSEGGNAWEDLRRARWADYVSSYFTLDPELEEAVGHWEAASRSKERLALLAENIESLGYRKLGEVEWSTTSPWKATYWKTLPFAYTVRVQCCEFAMSQPWPQRIADALRWHD